MTYSGNKVESCGTYTAEMITPIKLAPSSFSKGMTDDIGRRQSSTGKTGGL